jgi:hypothetical protein
LIKYRQHGQDALAWHKPAGATAKLTDAQLVQLVKDGASIPKLGNVSGWLLCRWSLG